MSESSKEVLEKQVLKLVNDAYELGKRDAIASIMSVVGAAPSYQPVASSGEFTFYGGNGGNSRIAAPDSVIMRVKDYIAENPGRTGAAIIKGLKQETPDLKERTVRTSLERLKGRKMIHNSLGRWYVL